MIVDDEEWCITELYGMLLAFEGVEITGAFTNADDALKAAVRDGPDLIFIDVQMPGMHGLELAEKIKETLNEVDIVLVSEKETFARNGFDIGVMDFILKPLRAERVSKALRKSR